MIQPTMRNLIRFFSYRSFIFSALIIGLILAGLLARDGLTAFEAALLAAYAALGVGLNLWRRTPPEKRAHFDALAAFDQVLATGRPTLLEFYSDNCAVCMLMRPVMDTIELQSGHRLQTLRVDVTSDIGKALVDRYSVTLTPTFILFDGAGVRQEEFLLALDRSRVLYWLNKHTPAA